MPADTADLPEQRILEASMLLRGRGAVTGWAALRLHGARFLDGLDVRTGAAAPVPLVLGPHQRRRLRDGVSWSQDRLDEADVVVRQGVRVTRPERAAFDAARSATGVRAATITFDMAIAAELTSVRRLGRCIDLHSGWDGVPIARDALRLASERSRSPAETDLRITWEVDAGLPPPLVNCEVFSRRTGRLLGVADLLDVESGLVVEFDGADHAGARRRSSDARREGGLRDHGLEVERTTGYDLVDRPALVRRLHAARRRAQWEPLELRRWTIEPPPGWERGPGLDERLDLRDFLRACDEASPDELPHPRSR